MAVYSPGYLLFVRDGTLFAIRCDPETMETQGEPTRVADRVGFFSWTFGYAAISASTNGALAFGPSVLLSTNLQWRNRSGALVGTLGAPNAYRSPRLSPDESSVAFSMIDDQGPDIWLMELTRGGVSRLISDPRSDWFPT
jgi:hypothetical protein